jgi:Zn-dependent M28 family amino/carboxypeptidase
MTGSSPGADDNASGVATLLSVARVLSQSSTPYKRNIIFVAFSGEEQGLIGSSHFAEKRAPSMNIKSAIILDQDGNPGRDWGIIFESVGSNTGQLKIIDTLAESTDKKIGNVSTSYDGFGSDHVSLTEIGHIPSVLVIERDNMEFAKEYGHTSNDTIAHVDPIYGSAIARTVAEAIARLANDPQS